MCCFYNLEINPLLATSLQILSPVLLSCLVILFIVFFAVQKLLSLIRSHFFIFVFISITLGDGVKTSMAVTYQRAFCLSFLLGVL